MNTLSVLVALSGIFLLGASRLRVSIQLVALQGVLLGVASIIHSMGDLSLAAWGIGIGGIGLKGVLLPWLLGYVLRRSGAKLEIEPFIGFGVSILSGLILLGLASWIAWKINLQTQVFSARMFAVALYLVLTGLFLIITRRKALNQALGYLVMENGVYAMGVGIGHEFSFLVEMGVMLDVFVGVFLMSIMIFEFEREFEHVDADRFTALSDLVIPDRSSEVNHEIEL
jgi:hydrogenase-4 component E